MANNVAAAAAVTLTSCHSAVQWGRLVGVAASTCPCAVANNKLQNDAAAAKVTADKGQFLAPLTLIKCPPT